jgi:S-(hydroxymethyl)glutathione dehydrogenase/alcohol dehydrogenase
MTNLCDLGALFVDNCLPDGTFRFHGDGEDFGQMCLLGTFSQHSVVSEHSCVKIDDDLPLETMALVGCGVPTGWGTAVNAGGVRPPRCAATTTSPPCSRTPTPGWPSPGTRSTGRWWR